MTKKKKNIKTKIDRLKKELKTAKKNSNGVRFDFIRIPAEKKKAPLKKKIKKAKKKLKKAA